MTTTPLSHAGEDLEAIGDGTPHSKQLRFFRDQSYFKDQAALTSTQMSQTMYSGPTSNSALKSGNFFVSQDLRPKTKQARRHLSTLTRGRYDQDGKRSMIRDKPHETYHSFVEKNLTPSRATKFNNSPHFCLSRILDRSKYFTHYDVYNLNQAFGLPSELAQE